MAEHAHAHGVQTGAPATADRARTALGLATVEVLDLPVVRSSGVEVLEAIGTALDRGSRVKIAYVNAHTATMASHDPGFHSCLRRFDLLLNDGAGVALAARLNGCPVVENLNGSDFTLRLLRLAAARSLSVFLYGARPGVAEQAARNLATKVSDLRVVGASHGYRADGAALVEEIRSSGANVVLAALGNPLQEQWLSANLDATGAACGVGVGAFLDFTAETVRRAPRWVNRYGAEWLFRFAQEPRRLARRYMVGGPVFLWRVTRRRPPRSSKAARTLGRS